MCTSQIIQLKFLNLISENMANYQKIFCERVLFLREGITYSHMFVCVCVCVYVCVCVCVVRVVCVCVSV